MNGSMSFNRREGLKPKDVTRKEAEKVLAFLNAARTSDDIARAVEIPGERDVGSKVAQNILDERDRIGRFTDLEQVFAVKHVGQERFADIVDSLKDKVFVGITPSSEAEAVDLGIVIASVLRSIALAKRAVDEETINLAKAYQKHEMLKHLTIPSFAVEEVDLSLRFIIEGIEPDKERDHQSYKINVILNSKVLAQYPDSLVSEARIRIVPSTIKTYDLEGETVPRQT